MIELDSHLFGVASGQAWIESRGDYDYTMLPDTYLVFLGGPAPKFYISQVVAHTLLALATVIILAAFIVRRAWLRHRREKAIG